MPHNNNPKSYYSYNRRCDTNNNCVCYNHTQNNCNVQTYNNCNVQTNHTYHHENLLPNKWMVDTCDKIKETESVMSPCVCLSKINKFGDEFTMMHASQQQANSMSEMSRSLYFISLFFDITAQSSKNTLDDNDTLTNNFDFNKHYTYTVSGAPDNSDRTNLTVGIDSSVDSELFEETSDTDQQIIDNTNDAKYKYGVKEFRKLINDIAFKRLNEKEVAAHYIQKNCIDMIEDTETIPKGSTKSTTEFNGFAESDYNQNANWVRYRNDRIVEMRNSNHDKIREWRIVKENLLEILNSSEYIIHQLNKFANNIDDMELSTDSTELKPIINAEDVEIIEVKELNKDKQEIKNKIKDDCSVIRFLLKYSMNLKSLKSLVKDHLQRANRLAKFNVDTIIEAIDTLSENESFNYGSNKFHYVEITVITSKTCPTTLLYFGKPERKRDPSNNMFYSSGTVEGGRVISSRSAVLPTIPKYNVVFGSINSGRLGARLSPINCVFDNSIYRNPNMYALVDLPRSLRLDTVRVFTNDSDYEIEILEGLMRSDSNSEFLEKGKTNCCNKLLYCLRSCAPSLPLRSGCNNTGNYAIIKLKHVNPETLLIEGGDVSFTSDNDCKQFTTSDSTTTTTITTTNAGTTTVTTSGCQ